MCSESVCVCYINAATYYPPNTSGWTTQWFWPLFLYQISPPVALSTVCHLFIHYLSIILWPFPMLLISLPLLFVFGLIDFTSPPSVSHFAFDILFSVFTLSFAVSSFWLSFVLAFLSFTCFILHCRLTPLTVSVSLFHSSSARPQQMRSGSTCKRWGSSTLGSLSMSSAMAHWCCKTWAKAPRPHRARCSLAQ